MGELSELQGRTQSATLEAVYEKFNIDHPADYKGHSLSVSDIVVLHEDGKNRAHFVDSFGFTGLPDFMRELEGVEEQEKEGIEPEVPQEEAQDTSRHDVQKSEPAFEDMEDEDENIDLGDEKDQVLAQMKKSLKGEQETELAFVVENFKAKTNELFHEISEMNPAEIEETVKCHVQAQLDESGWHGCGDCGRGSSGEPLPGIGAGRL